MTSTTVATSNFDPEQYSGGAKLQDWKKFSLIRENAMITSTTEQLDIPSEIRVLAERSIARAKLDFKSYIRATEEVACNLEARVEVTQLAAEQISKMAMDFALRDALSAFEFAQKVIQAKNVADFTKLLGNFVNPQMQALTEQWETFCKAAIDSINIPTTSH